MALDGNGNGRGNGPFDPKGSDIAAVIADHADHVGKTERHERKLKGHEAQLEAIAITVGNVDRRLGEQGLVLMQLATAFETQARAADVVAVNFERLVRELTVNQAHRDWLTKSIQRLAETKGVELEPAP